MTSPAVTPRAPLTSAELDRLLTTPPWWRQSAMLKSLTIAVVSTLILFGGFALLLSQSEGWEQVRQAFFSWPNFKEAWPKVVEGFKLNIKIFMIAEPIVLAVGLLLAIIRVSKSPALFPLRAVAIVYIDFFRGAPALLVIFMLGFGVPGLRLEGMPTSPVFWGAVACILTSAAYTAETFRAGIESVHPSQRAAARSLGLNNAQSFMHVVLPQGIRAVIPPLLSGFVALQKETSLVSAIGPLEATRQAQIYSSLTFNYTSYLVAALLFIAITVPLARLTDHLLSRSAKLRQVGGDV
ncbi:MAG TPA: amino acid ABC transporter permease [Thermomicrobiales bacterium]|nr:amino acid ABC transporter permease [Thermomicrobiales bacterium]